VSPPPGRSAERGTPIPWCPRRAHRGGEPRWVCLGPNVFPQIANFNVSAYARLERGWRAVLRGGGTVEIDIALAVDPDNPFAPSFVIVTSWETARNTSYHCSTKRPPVTALSSTRLPGNAWEKQSLQQGPVEQSMIRIAGVCRPSQPDRRSTMMIGTTAPVRPLNLASGNGMSAIPVD